MKYENRIKVEELCESIKTAENLLKALDGEKEVRITTVGAYCNIIQIPIGSAHPYSAHANFLINSIKDELHAEIVKLKKELEAL